MSPPTPSNLLLSKGDLKQVNDTATGRGWSKEKREAFGRYLEDSKREGDRRTKNERGDYTWQEMQDRADEFDDGYNGS